MSTRWRMWAFRERVLGVYLIWAALFIELCVIFCRPLRPALLWNALFVILALWLSIPWHEVGHVVIGRLVGLRAVSVQLGMGPLITRFDLHGVRIRLHALQVLGLTFCAPRAGRRFSRAAFFAMVLGGPLFSAAIAAAVYALPGHHSLRNAFLPQHFGVRADPIAALGFVNLLLCVVNLLPIRDKSSGGVRPMDGRLLLTLPFASQKVRSELAVLPWVAEAHEAFQEEDVARGQAACAAGLKVHPGSTPLRSMSASLALLAGSYREARDAFLDLDVHASIDQALRPLLWNNIAWADVKLSDPGLLDEADDYSSRALKALPTMPALKGTRGTVLLALGRLDEARPLLAEALALSPSANGRAHNSAALAILEARAGRNAEAERHLKEARSICPTCDAIPEAERAITAAGQPGAASS